MKHCIHIISHSILCIVFEIIYIYHMYSFLFIYIYVLEVYTWQGYWVWYILHAMGVILWLSTSTCQLALSSDTPLVSSSSTCIPFTSTVSFPISVCCSLPKVLYVKVFLDWMYIFFTYLYRYYKVFIMHIYCYIYVSGCFSHHKWYSRYIL